MTVVLGEPIPYYLELEPLEDGIPRMRITLYNIPGSSTVEVRRSCEGETWPVPGVKSQAVSDTAVFVDWCCPLNRNVTYTVLVGGQTQSVRSAVLPSASSWLQDPIRPDTGLPVGEQVTDGALSLADGALSSGTYVSEATQHRVMGDKYPRSFGGQRQSATDVGLPVYSSDEATNEQMLEMCQSPILLFRPYKKLRPLPAVAYLSAKVSEEPLDQHNGGSFTRWNVTGNLVAAVAQTAVTGQVTYEDVQALLGGYTYGQVQEIAGATTYLDWLKDPLLFTNLSAPSTMSTKV